MPKKARTDLERTSVKRSFAAHSLSLLAAHRPHTKQRRRSVYDGKLNTTVRPCELFIAKEEDVVSKLKATFASYQSHVAAGRCIYLSALLRMKSSFRKLKYGRFGAGAQGPPVGTTL